MAGPLGWRVWALISRRSWRASSERRHERRRTTPCAVTLHTRDSLLIISRRSAQRCPAVGGIVDAVITNTLQTSAGRMDFAKVADADDGH